MRPHVVERKLLAATANCRSSSTLSVLPDELMMEILLRLPVSSLLQLRSVCLSWKAFISSPKFARDHLQRSIADPTLTHPRLAYCTLLNMGKIGFCSLPSLFENPSAPTRVVVSSWMRCSQVIVGSCNGLLCLSDDGFYKAVRLWNPCIGVASEWVQVGRAGDVKRVAYCGFGCDRTHDKYKCVLGSVKVSGETVTQVCTFGPNSSWTTLQHPPKFVVQGRDGKFVSGTLNWIATALGPTGTVDWKYFEWVILSFDLGKETFGRVFLPDKNYHHFRMPELQVLRNCLSVCFAPKRYHWDVWLMKTYGVEDSWTKLVEIPHAVPLAPLYISENDVVLAKGENDDLSINGSSHKLVLYNSSDGGLNYPMIDSSSDGLLGYPMTKMTYPRRFHIYHESLVSPSHCGLGSCLTR